MGSIRSSAFALVLLVVTGVAGPHPLSAAGPRSLWAAGGAAASAAQIPSRLRPAVYGPHLILQGGAPGAARKAAAGAVVPDSFYLYGGPGTVEGRFQTQQLLPDRQGWIGVDRTEAENHWQVSTFQAAALDSATGGNHAAWAGRSAAQEPGWNAAPGYGNNRDDWLVATFTLTPGVDHSVRLEFVYNHDTEPAYDFLRVERGEAGGSFVLIAPSIDGDNRGAGGVFVPLHFDETFTVPALALGGPGSDQLVLRLRVISDGAWSDEDGLWDTDGAAQVDRIRVSVDGTEISFTDFEAGPFVTPPTYVWTPVPNDYVGDFSKVYTSLEDIDPCRANLSPQMTFLDDGTAPNNVQVPLPPGFNGSTSSTWSYGAPGGWVVNYTGGLTFGAKSLANEVWSPEIIFDDPATTQDDQQGSVVLRFEVWQHLPLLNGIFWQWHVRSFNGTAWEPWQDRSFVYYGDGTASYVELEREVADLLVDGLPAGTQPEKVQIALAAIDLAELFGFPGDDATPSPWFDNVSLLKVQAPGPLLSARNIDLFGDGFPHLGHLDLASRKDELWVRIDAAASINRNRPVPLAGDSLRVDVTPVIPGTQLAGPPTLRFRLFANPAFADVRELPAGVDSVGSAADGATVYEGAVIADSAIVNGQALANVWTLDLGGDGGPRNPALVAEPAEPKLFWPGDVLHYFVGAADDQGNVSLLPADTTGFARRGAYNRVFTVRALPSLRADGSQPPILVWNDFGHRGGEDELLQSLHQNGLVEGVDFDTYTTLGPSSGVDNGLGSAGVHGATPDQLAGYDCLVYTSGNLSQFLINDGSDASGNDRSDDVGLLTTWHGQAADRFAVYFGDKLASGLFDQGSVTAGYLMNVLGVDVLGPDVRPDIGNQTAPVVVPTGEVPTAGLFATEFVAFGGCPSLNRFDDVVPLAGAVSSHEFLGIGGQSGLYPAAAGVWYERLEDVGGTTYRRVDLLFPYDLSFVDDRTSGVGSPDGRSARARLLAEVLAAFGHGVDPGAATAAAPAPRRLVLHGAAPNPFNPRTTLRYEAPAKGRVVLKVYNPRGQIVRTLLDEVVEAGLHEVVFDGHDDAGRRLSSGVYLYRLEGFGQKHVGKMALVK